MEIFPDLFRRFFERIKSFSFRLCEIFVSKFFFSLRLLFGRWWPWTGDESTMFKWKKMFEKWRKSAEYSENLNSMIAFWKFIFKHIKLTKFQALKLPKNMSHTNLKIWNNHKKSRVAENARDNCVNFSQSCREHLPALSICGLYGATARQRWSIEGENSDRKKLLIEFFAIVCRIAATFFLLYSSV